jgi:competence protein ComEA
VETARAALRSVAQAWAGSTWTPVAGRAAAYLAGLVLLALLGSGRLNRWLGPAKPIEPIAAVVPAPSVSAATFPVDPPDGAVAVDSGVGNDGPAEIVADLQGEGPGIGSDGKVVLNLATESDLRHLPGIGVVRARAILALRARLKHFGRVEDLLKVKGIGRRSLARLRPLVRVD